jgi:hypothetical protein
MFTMDRREAAFHSSAEQYREQAKLARNSAEFESNEDDRAKLLASARNYKQLAISGKQRGRVTRLWG